MERFVQPCRYQVLTLISVLFALAVVLAAGDRAATGNSFDSLVILGVGTSVGSPTEFWGTDLVFSNPSSIEGELIINEKPIEDQSQSYRPIAAAAFLPLAGSVRAEFMVDPNPDGDKFYNGDAYKNVSSFTGTVGGQHSGPEVTVDTVGNVDTGAGFSTIKPVKDGTLTRLTFTPALLILRRPSNFGGSARARVRTFIRSA